VAQSFAKPENFNHYVLQSLNLIISHFIAFLINHQTPLSTFYLYIKFHDTLCWVHFYLGTSQI